MKDKLFVVGITGFAQSGKTFVLNVLKELGWITINADAVVADLYRVGEKGYRMIKEEFGSGFVDEKAVNSKMLSDFIAKNPRQLETLNDLIHPLVLQKITALLALQKSSDSHPVKVAVEAVYFKKGQLYDLLDKLVFVSRPEALIPKTEPFYSYLKHFYAEQMPKPDAVLLNDADLPKLKASVIEFFSHLPYK